MHGRWGGIGTEVRVVRHRHVFGMDRLIRVHGDGVKARDMSVGLVVRVVVMMSGDVAIHSGVMDRSHLGRSHGHDGWRG